VELRNVTATDDDSEQENVTFPLVRKRERRRKYEKERIEENVESRIKKEKTTKRWKQGVILNHTDVGSGHI